jgi:hypothetical protein
LDREGRTVRAEPHGLVGGPQGDGLVALLGDGDLGAYGETGGDGAHQQDD